MIFETPRLIGRHLVASDPDAMHAVYGDAGAMRWVGDGEPLERDRCARWIDVTHRNYALRGYGMTALVDRATGDTVGFVGLVHPNDQVEAELKYALHRAWWGRGLATEGATGMLAYAASVLGLDHVIATAAPEHARLASRADEGRPAARRGAAQRRRLADPAVRVARGAAPEWRLTSTSTFARRRLPKQCGIERVRQAASTIDPSQQGVTHGGSRGPARQCARTR